jgi:hypothetical protein
MLSKDIAHEDHGQVYVIHRNPFDIKRESFHLVVYLKDDMLDIRGQLKCQEGTDPH